jgi:nitrate/nitrite transporter NarK
LLVLDLTQGDLVAFAFVTFMSFVPQLLVLLWGGLLADRLDEWRILVWTNLVLGLLAVLMTVLERTQLIELWHVYTASTLTAIVSAIGSPRPGTRSCGRSSTTSGSPMRTGC